MAVIFTRAHLPEELTQAWLQHLRDFDVAHPDCHFEVAVDFSKGVTLTEAVERLKVEPELRFVDIFLGRGK